MHHKAKLTNCFFTCEHSQDDFHSYLTGSVALLRPRSQNSTTSLSSLFSKSNFFENMYEKRFLAFETSLQDYVGSMANRNSRVKTKRDVQLFEELLRKEEKVN